MSKAGRYLQKVWGLQEGPNTWEASLLVDWKKVRKMIETSDANMINVPSGMYFYAELGFSPSL